MCRTTRTCRTTTLIAIAIGLAGLAGCGSPEQAAREALAKQGLTEVTLTAIAGDVPRWGVTGTKDGAPCEGVVKRVGSAFEADLKCASATEAAQAAAEEDETEAAADDPHAEQSKACEGGDLDQCVALGVALVEGPPATRDPARAREVHAKACEGGKMASCTALGHLHLRGLGGQQDEAAADALFVKACEAGHMDGCAGQAKVQYLNRKFKAARPLFQKACDGGSIPGCLGLAAALKDGEGGKADPKEARRLYDQLCAAAETTACTNLALMLHAGEGGTKSAERAAKLLREACEAKDTTACAHKRRLGL